MTVEVDPIDLSVFWNSMLSIAEEMSSTLRRTAFSEAVREGDDFSTGIFDREGRLVAQGNCSPGHLGSMPYIVSRVADFHAFDTLEPGDSVLVNDSAIGSGHYPDFCLITPVFNLQAERIAFVVNIAHHVDVGGATPGSQTVRGVTEAYQEGLRILPVRIFRRNELQSDLLTLITGNVRVPTKVEGDLKAQRNANHVGAVRVVDLFDKLGMAHVTRLIEEIYSVSEQRTRSALRQLPDGSYHFVDHLDDVGPGTDAVRMEVTVTVKDGEVIVDFAGTSPQVAAGINSYLNYTRAYAAFAVLSIAGVHVSQNHGALRSVKVDAPEGSFLNPRFPAASGGRAAVQIRIFEVVTGALAPAAPARALAGFSHWSNPNIGGTDPETREAVVIYDAIMGGYGARQGADGEEGLCPVFNCANIPVEVHEQSRAVRVRRFGFIPDSGGAGEFRGGCGVRKDIEILVPEATVSLLSDRHSYAPFGLEGAQPGALGRTVLMHGGKSDAVDLNSKDRITARRGDVFSFSTSGGGGYGAPHSRDKGAIERDVSDGFITAENAAQIYGFSKVKISSQREKK